MDDTDGKWIRFFISFALGMLAYISLWFGWVISFAVMLKWHLSANSFIINTVVLIIIGAILLLVDYIIGLRKSERVGLVYLIRNIFKR